MFLLKILESILMFKFFVLNNDHHHNHQVVSTVLLNLIPSDKSPITMDGSTKISDMVMIVWMFLFNLSIIIWYTISALFNLNLR